MKLRINNIFFGTIYQITNITHKTTFEPYMDTQTTHHMKLIKQSIFYKKNKNLFIDLENNQKYSSNIHSSNTGHLVLDPRKLVPIYSICDKLNIELPNKQKISKKELVKCLNKHRN